MKKIINTDNAPAAIGPYSQANMANGVLYISGQIPVDPKTGKPTRVGRRESSDGRTFVRYAKKSGEEIK